MPRIDIKNKSFIDFVGEGITTSNAGALAIVNIGGGTFISLIDTPASYAGSNSKLVGVNSAGDGLEFVDGGSGSITGDITFNGTITDLRAGSFELISSADNITGTAASISISIVDNNFAGSDHIKLVGRPYSTGDLVPGTDFAIGVSADITAQNLADKINAMNMEATATVIGSVITVTADYGGTWGNLFKVYKNDGITENFTITGGEVFYDYGIAENGWLFTGGVNGPAAYKFNTINTINTDATRLFSIENNDTEFFSIREGIGWNDGHNNDDRTILTFNNKDGMEKLQLVMGPGNNGSPGFYTTQGRSLFFMANTDYSYQYPGYQSVEVGLWPWNPSYSISIEDAGLGNSEFELRRNAGWFYAEDQVSGDYGWVGAFTTNYNEAGRSDVRFIAEAIGHIGITDGGVFFGGNKYTNPDMWALESQAVNGASSIAYQMDTRNQLTTFGAKLLSLQNFTVEKFAVDKDGNVSLGGTVDGVDVSTLPALINAKMTNPMTASGDIVYGAASGTPARLGKGSNGQYLSLISGLPAWSTLPGGVTTFTGLSDTPSSFSGQGTKAVRVNSGATGLEFVDFPAGVTTFLNLTDSPSSYSGQTKKFLKVNSAGNAVEFVDIPVQDNGSAIVTQPSAFNFTGVGVTVSDSGGVAEINIPGVASGLVDWKESVLDKDLTTAPTGVEGARYIIAGIGGAWSGFTIDDMVTYVSSAWQKETPEEGFAAWVEDEDKLYVYSGTGWVKFGTTITHGNLLGLTADDHTIYLLATGARNLSGNLGVNAGITIDGRDISVDGTTLDTHLNGGASKHDASEIDVEGTYANIPGTPTDLESALSSLNTVIAGSSTFIGSTDTPSAYTGEAGKIPRVNDAEDALEFITQPNGALGGYQERLTYNANDSTTSTSFVDMVGAAAQNFTTPVTGPHILTVHMPNAWYNHATAGVGEYALNIDGTDYVFTTQRFNGTSADYEAVHGTVIVDLAAGQHAIKPRWRVHTGPGPLQITNGPDDSVYLIIDAQGSGINGLEIIEDTMTGGSFTVTSVFSDVPGGNMAQVSDVQVTFNALEGERVEIKYIGQAQMNGSDNIILGYQMDSDTPIETHYTYDTTTTSARDISFNRFTDPLSAGQHTVKLMASKSVGNASIYDDDTYNSTSARLQVIRYKSFGLGAGTIVTTATTPSNWTQTTASTFEDVPSLEIEVIAIEDEQVQLTCLGSIWGTAAGSVGVQMRFSIDGTTFSENPYTLDNNGSATYRLGLSYVWTTPALTAGPHTIKVQGYKNGTTTNRWDTGFTFQATQYRGGLIPVLDEGISVVDKPSALDFAGAGVTVTQSGTKALITIPSGGSAIEVDDEGTPLTTSVTKFNFAGAGVTVTEPVTDEMLVTIPGGGGGAKTRYATATSYTTSDEDIIGVTDTTADRTITLATADVADGKEMIVKDESGAVYANGTTITVDTEGSETIDGVSSVPITMDYGVLRLYSDGTNWFTV